jgi:D-glycero-D-manno-heptose 1,7-bisphosphate phosphatase
MRTGLGRPLAGTPPAKKTFVAERSDGANPRRFVVLDRDGTIIVHHPYLSDPAQVELLPGAAEGLRALRNLGLGLVVATNQSALGRGYFSVARLDEIHARMHALLAAEGITLDGVYYCPHTPDDTCACRKPSPGLVHAAASEHRFRPSETFVVGDNVCDIQLGQQVGATTLLVTTGYGREVAVQRAARPDYLVAGLPQVADMIGWLLNHRAAA